MSERIPGLDDKIRVLLTEHPTWSVGRIAEAAGCGETAVQRRRKKWGLESGIKLPWLHPEHASSNE